MCAVELNVAPLLAAARRIAWNGVRRCCAAIRPKPSALYPGWSGRRKRVRQLCRTSSRIPKHGVDQRLLYQTLRARTFGPLSAPPLNRQTLLHKPRWDTQQDARPTRLQPTRDARGRRYNTCDENLRRKMEHVRRYVEPSRQPSQSNDAFLASDRASKGRLFALSSIFRSYLAESTRSHSEFGS